VEEVLERVTSEGAEVMVATHNQGSIEHTVRLMSQLGIEPPSSAGVFFGQLLGMADHLTFTLGRNGYRVRFVAEHSTFALDDTLLTPVMLVPVAVSSLHTVDCSPLCR